MSISSIMSTGLSALAANQAALKATSTNVANVNTVGYSRLDVQFISRQASGGLSGVEIEVRRVANAYLAAAEMRGAADVASADIMAQFMDRAQGLLGDPSDASTVFATLDPVFASFGALAIDPASALRRSSTLSDLQTMLSQFDTTGRELQALRDESHSRVQASVAEANSLLASIAKLNTSIQRSTISGVQASEAETEQQRMIDRLSEIMDLRAQQRPLGGVELRTTDGMLLVDVDAAQLGFSSVRNGEPYPGLIIKAPRSSTETPFETHLQGGELQGLLRTRDKEIVNLQLAFGEFAAGTAEALNAAHNAASTVPAPASMTGRNTGLLETDLLNFSGVTHVGIVDNEGNVIRNFRIDFNNGQILDDQANVTPFGTTVADLRDALNTAMAPDATMSFAGGVMQISADVPNTGIAITDDPTTPGTRAGRGFSHTFGLNDLLTHSQQLSYATGLSASDDHGFADGVIKFALRNQDGAIVRTFDFQVTAGTSLGTLRGQLSTAVQGFGTATLDANGRITLTPTHPNIGSIDVLQDTTERGDTGVSMSEMFGFGEQLGLARAQGSTIRADIKADPNLLAAAQADLAGAASGTRVLSPGDGRGALSLEAAGTKPRQFVNAGGLGGQTTSVIDYAARLAGHAGVRAEALDGAKAAAESVREEVKQRRMSEEGVNLDEELVKMTTYQQAYAAASRMIQAAKDLFDITLNMV
ncbi:MAG: flagellar hook-associated protein FlgK [Alphaproteobacteria bacterium]|jgi:flagellar hook-associated protein 1|nr:MAG: flagellar hook-associated protein FlgK [Alphaproteobacteria bacterium]